MYITRDIEAQVLKLAGFYPIYSSSMSVHLKSFRALAPHTENPLVIYSGETMPNVAAHYSDTHVWMK